MLQEFASQIIELLLVLPITLLSIRKSKGSWKLILLCFLFYLISSNSLRVVFLFPQLDFIGGYWNWSGKAFSIIVSVLFYFIFKSKLKENDFFTLKQVPNSLKPAIFVSILVLFYTFLNAYFCFNSDTFDFETLLFQLTMPGLDEEISYRGILLGMFLTALKPSRKMKRLRIEPAIWIVSFWFGMVHSFGFDNEWRVTQDWFIFLNSFLIGFALAWVAQKTKSILLPIIVHNLSNVIVVLVVT